ncbi:LysR family transcriptional regulator [Haliangium sp.]|uniref:LysR family transcriptional regulator n=1 Tax=Haliangium sp. TaxID=2663208 RepID=UPI003D10E858
MADIELSSIDLNLLVALDALLETLSITRAARRVGVTQSTMSHTLARLRTLLGDPILVRAGRTMTPTPRAEALAAPLRRTLTELSRLLGAEAGFALATSTRSFSLVCLDHLAPVVPDLLARMRAEAPGTSLTLSTPARGEVGHALLAGAGELALAPPQPETPGLMRRRLGEVSWSVFGRADHPAFAGRFTRRAWLAYPHVVVRVGSSGPGVVGAALARVGLERTVGLVVPGFLHAPLAVSRTDLLFTSARPTMLPLAAAFGLAERTPPVKIPEVPIVMYWPERLHGDPGHRWFRTCVAELITTILADAS